MATTPYTGYTGAKITKNRKLSFTDPTGRETMINQELPQGVEDVRLSGDRITFVGAKNQAGTGFEQSIRLDAFDPSKIDAESFAKNYKTTQDEINAAKYGQQNVTPAAATPDMSMQLTDPDPMKNYERKRQELVDLMNPRDPVTGQSKPIDAATKSALQVQLDQVNKNIEAIRSISDEERYQKDRENAYRAKQKEVSEREQAKGASQKASIASQFMQSPEGVNVSGTQQITDIAGKAIDKNVQSIISNDPEIAELEAIYKGTGERIATMKQALEDIKVADVQGQLKDYADRINQSLADLQTDLLDNAQTQADEQLGSLLTPEALAVFADSPELLDNLLSSFPETTFNRAKILGASMLQKRINEIEAKKQPTEKEVLELEKLRIEVENAKAPQTRTPFEFEAKIGVLDAMLSQGLIDQETYTSGIQNVIGVSQKDRVGNYELKEVDGRTYVFDKNTGSLADYTPGKSPAIGSVGNGVITQQFGSTATGELALLSDGRKGTPGIDIDGKTGDIIKSFVGGTVVKVVNDNSYNQGYGNQVIIQDDDGNLHWYNHLSNANVSAGQKIGSGYAIGAMGNTGRVFGMNGQAPSPGDKESGSHLDYRVQSKTAAPNGSRWIDPNKFIPKNIDGYTEGQKFIMSQIDPTKITSSTLNALEEAGLSVRDLAEYRATEKTQLPEEKKQVIRDIISQIGELKTHGGFNDAVGFGPGRIVSMVPGSSGKSFAIKFNTFKDTLALPALDKLKGAMSDKDLEFLRNTATSLNLDLSEKEFAETLKKLEDKYNAILEGGSTNPPMQLRAVSASEPLYDQVWDQIEQLKAENVSDADIEATLIEQGIDPDSFTNPQ